MFKRIVVGFDESSGSRDALVLGRQLADRMDAELVLVGVVPPSSSSHLMLNLHPTAFTRMVTQAAAGLEAAATEFGASTEIVESISASRGLSEFSEGLEDDLVVVGCTGAEPGKVRAGHKARVLMQGSPCAVAIAPVGYQDNPGELTRIGAAVVGTAVDGSPEWNMALNAAVDITAIDIAGPGRSIRLVSVANDYTEAWGFWSASLRLAELGDASRNLAQDILRQALASIPDGIDAQMVMLEGKAAEQLRLQTEDGLDMLCVGSRCYGPIRRVLLGSVSSELLRDASCPIVVLPRC